MVAKTEDGQVVFQLADRDELKAQDYRIVIDERGPAPWHPRFHAASSLMDSRLGSGTRRIRLGVFMLIGSYWPPDCRRDGRAGPGWSHLVNNTSRVLPAGDGENLSQTWSRLEARPSANTRVPGQAA
jgi:hypothetical protein